MIAPVVCSDELSEECGSMTGQDSFAVKMAVVAKAFQ